MTLPIYTAFYTRNTLYEHEANRLRRCLQHFNLPYDFTPIDSRGTWAANTHYTPQHILAMLDKYPGRPVVYLDADAVLWSRPELFDTLSPDTTDIAVHYRIPSSQLANGTLWLANTPACHRIIEQYSGACCADPEFKDEQLLLQRAIDGAARSLPSVLNVYKLPGAYCWIHDIMASELSAGTSPVIEHLQASRVDKQSKYLPGRMERLLKIAATLPGNSCAEDILKYAEEPIAVVGNGTLQDGAGAVIDAHPTVIRLNNYRITGYESRTGVRTSVWCVNCWPDVPPRAWDGDTICVCSRKERKNGVKAWQRVAPRLRLASTSWLTAARDIKPHAPSTGVALLYQLARMKKRVDVWAFDGLRGGHYFDAKHKHNHPDESAAIEKLKEMDIVFH